MIKKKRKKISFNEKNLKNKKTFQGVFCIRQIAKWFLSFPRSRNRNLYDEIGKKKRKTSDDVCRQLRWQWILLLAPRARNCQVRREKSESFDRCQWTGQRRIHRRIGEKDRRGGGWARRSRERKERHEQLIRTCLRILYEGSRWFRISSTRFGETDSLPRIKNNPKAEKVLFEKYKISW